MRQIVNKEDADQYYSTVNKLIDKYILDHKIRPSELNKYFTKNMKLFLEDSKLSDVSGIDRIVRDVLTHRNHMELDGILKFESFNTLNESVISIGNSTIQHEKILADLYNTGLGHIELLDNNLHIYKVNDFDEKVISIIFSDDELSIIYRNIESKVLEESKKRVINISDIDNVSIESPIKIWLSDIISDDKFREVFNKKVDKNQLLLIIKKIIQSKQDLPTNFSDNRLSYKEEYKGYHIWEVK